MRQRFRQASELTIIQLLIGGLLLGYPTINQGVFNLLALVVSFVGAVILLPIVNLIRYGSVR